MKKQTWPLLIPAVLLSASFAYADTLDELVNKDLYTSNLSAPQDLEQTDFKKEGVEQAPPSLTPAEEKQLKAVAELLWNRDWYMNNPGKTESQQDRAYQRSTRVPEAVAAYNKVIDDIKLEEKQTAQNADLQKQTAGQLALSQCQPQLNTLATDNLKNLVIATNASTQQAVQSDQATDASKIQATHLDPMPANLKSDPTPSAALKVSVPDGGFLVSMAQDPANPQTVYAMDLLPRNVNVTRGGTIVSNVPYDFVRSDDGGKTWIVVSKLLTTEGDLLDTHIAVSKGAKDILVTTNDGVMETKDGGASFATLPGSLSKPVDVKLSSDGSELVVSYNNGEGVQTFSNQNGNWSPSASQPADLVKWVNQQYNSDPRCQAATFSNCPYDVGASLKVDSVQLDPTQPGVLYAGLGQGEYKYQNGAWSLVQGMGADTTVNNIEIGSDGKMLVATCNGIYQGQTSQNQVSKVASPNFINQDTGASSPSYLRSYEVASNPQNAKEVVSVSASGVYISKDGGSTWSRQNVGAAPGHGSSYTQNEFRSAVWLPDGTVEVSSPSATYDFTP